MSIISPIRFKVGGAAILAIDIKNHHTDNNGYRNNIPFANINLRVLFIS